MGNSGVLCHVLDKAAALSVFQGGRRRDGTFRRLQSCVNLYLPESIIPACVVTLMIKEPLERETSAHTTTTTTTQVTLFTLLITILKTGGGGLAEEKKHLHTDRMWR